MKKSLFTALLIALFSFSVSAQVDLGSILKGLGGQNDTTSTSSSTGSGLGSILTSGTVGSLVSNLLGNGNLTPADMVGTWNYAAPAVAFESENLLKKAGGAAASATIESKIEPYYKKAGLNKMSLTVNPDSTFVMKLSRGSLSGTITRNADRKGYMTFHFQALNFNVGSMDAAVSKAAGNLTVTFDVTKLMKLVNTIASISGNSTVATFNKLLQSYDGMQAGFRLVKATDSKVTTTSKK